MSKEMALDAFFWRRLTQIHNYRLARGEGAEDGVAHESEAQPSQPSDVPLAEWCGAGHAEAALVEETEDPARANVRVSNKK